MRNDADPAPEREPQRPIPDYIPDDLVARYGSTARRTVRRSRSRTYPVVRSTRRVREAVARTVRDGDLWLTTLTFFAWSIVAAGAVGALVYAAMLMPVVASFGLLCLVALLGASFILALGRASRRAEEEVERSSL